MWRTLLAPPGWIYLAATWVRNRAYDAGVCRVERASVPVIAVGNLVAGGTGKTPLVQHLAERLLGIGRKVAVVSRGYGRRTRGPVIVSRGKEVLVTPAEGGDEPVLLARNVPGIAVVVAERRVAGAQIAAGECSADVILLDDGFQHRAIHRDLNILVLESGSAIEKELPLPAGMRREPLKGIGRANLVGWSGVRGEEVPAETKASVTRWFRGPMFGFRTETAGVRKIGIGEGKMAACEGKRVVAFCGIGNPARFSASVASLKPAATAEVRFPDHHAYRPSDIDALIERFLEFHADLFLTTEKDAVRLEGDEIIRENFVRQYPVAVLSVRARIVEGESLLAEALEQVLRRE